MAVPPAVRVGLTVAVRAQELQVFEAVVGPVAVDVMKLHVEARSMPLVDSALLAAVLLQAGLDQPELQVTSLRAAANHEELVKRNEARPRHDVAATDGSLPRVAGETEAIQALRH